jgi:hypothetical protein
VTVRSGDEDGDEDREKAENVEARESVDSVEVDASDEEAEAPRVVPL